MAKRQIKVTGEVRSGFGRVSQGIAGTPWEKVFYPGSINLYVLGRQVGRGGDAVGVLRRSCDGSIPPEFTPCRLNGVDGYIVNLHEPYPQKHNAPSSADYSMFEIVARTKIAGVAQGAQMSLEYEWEVKPSREELQGVRDKFMLAVHGMAESDAPLRERLQGAMETILVLREEDMPDEELRSEFRALVARTTRVEVPRIDGKLNTTIAYMAPEQVRAAAEQLCEIHVGLTYAADDAQDEQP